MVASLDWPTDIKESGQSENDWSMSLDAIEKRSFQDGGTAVLPEETRPDAPSPFQGYGSPGSRRSADFSYGQAPASRTPGELSQLQGAASQEVQSPFPPPQLAGENPFNTGSDESVTLLRLIAELLKQINEKLPTTATYSE